MSESHGRFTWYELMTTDTQAAKAFYSDVVGWTTQDMPMPDMVYTLFKVGDEPVSGLMPLPEEARSAGAPPHWLGYLAVDDVDATVALAERLGGHVYVEPFDVPNVGRLAVLADPQGAAFALFKWADSANMGSPQSMEPGRVGWRELTAVNWEQAFPFYGELFGWEKAEPIDMGDMGIYQLFSEGGETVGGMFTKPPSLPVPFWLYYFNVSNIDQAVERVTKGGGQILNGPMEVPGGAWIVQGMDPQGAMFALVGKRGD